jgi:hypothetical protein
MLGAIVEPRSAGPGVDHGIEREARLVSLWAGKCGATPGRAARAGARWPRDGATGCGMPGGGPGRGQASAARISPIALA